MTPTPILTYPEILIVGRQYKLRINASNEHLSSFVEVTFHSHTSSPEDVVILTTSGRKERVSRHEIYEKENA
jgi:hypothetical protein